MRPQLLRRVLSKEPSFADVDDCDEVFDDEDEGAREEREDAEERQMKALDSLQEGNHSSQGVEEAMSEEMLVLRDRASSLPDISDIFGEEEKYGPIPTYDDIREK